MQAPLLEATLYSQYIEPIIQRVTLYAPDILIALVLLIVGFRVIKWVTKLVERGLQNRHVDENLHPFLVAMVRFLLIALLIVTVAGQCGIPTTSFVAILGAAGLAIGLALQGSLANFAGGVLLLIFKPIKVGELIEVDGGFGFVKEISVFVTVLETFQNKTVILPNGPLAGGTITNYSRIGNIRADINFAIRYGADVDKAMEIALGVLKSSDLVLQDPAPSVYVTSLNENHIALTALPFTTVEGYWDVYWGLQDDLVKALGEAGFEAPFPQRVVHMQQG